jgi:Domain of unknown function (DUF4331)
MRGAERRRTVRRSAAVALAAALAATGCGGGGKAGDDTVDPHHDADVILDGATVPGPPALGAQIDRMGRPLIAAALIAGFAAPGPATTAIKDAYNQASDPAAWSTTILQPNVTVLSELKANLAAFDILDLGMANVSGAGCRNALRYVGTGNPGPLSYQLAAELFADDQLYVDTSKTACTVFMALEFEVASSGGLIHATCGGRTLTHDVVDTMYSVLAAGTNGVDPFTDFATKLHDSAVAHTDVSENFPFLAPPHP